MKNVENSSKSASYEYNLPGKFWGWGEKSINYTDAFPRLKFSRELNPKLTAWSLSKGVFKMKPCTSSWSDSVRPVSDLMVFQGDDGDQTMMISIYLAQLGWIWRNGVANKREEKHTSLCIMYEIIVIISSIYVCLCSVYHNSSEPLAVALCYTTPSGENPFIDGSEFRLTTADV